ncbi:hypothetical protein LNJ05_11365 [Tenacibaculum finnmarkense genomovar ulcerans]|uniref:hypothetical protein n=1 Tax=Tenacibaculum finnmarkense TaxID=2781243 RepID=UPI001E33E03A|nr:hypothetical protein [Tenacibaculum finnmarkense]MCD8433360.1 hypothetical protein [Tenacibaculum finnmarkense genomovar ulcerans]
MKKIIKIEKVNVISINLDTVQVKKRITVFNKIVFSYCVGNGTLFKNSLNL